MVFAKVVPDVQMISNEILMSTIFNLGFAFASPFFIDNEKKWQKNPKKVQK